MYISICPSDVKWRHRSGSILILVMAFSPPSHYLTKSWVIVNWIRRIKFQWNTQYTHLKMFCTKCRPCCSCLSVFTVIMHTLQWLQSSASLAFVRVRGIHREPVNSPHKGPVTRKMFPFDDVRWMSWYNSCFPDGIVVFERHVSAWHPYICDALFTGHCSENTWAGPDGS